MIKLWINKRRWRWGWEKNRFGIGFQPVASIPVFVAFQSMLRMADWVGGKVLSNLLTHIHIQTQPRPLWLNTPEMWTHSFFYLCGASRQLPLYECSLSSGCCRVSMPLMWKPSGHACDCVCRHLRGCVCFNAHVDTHTEAVNGADSGRASPLSLCVTGCHLSGLAAPPQAGWDEPFRQHHSSPDVQKNYLIWEELQEWLSSTVEKERNQQLGRENTPEKRKSI